MEYDDGDWKELRSKVNSLASSVFLISGGALTLSITVLLNLKQSEINIHPFVQQASWAWYLLLSAIISFVMLKVVTIAQSFARMSMAPDRYNPTIKYSNTISWLFGVAGVVSFVLGMFALVKLAVSVLCA